MFRRRMLNAQQPIRDVIRFKSSEPTFKYFNNMDGQESEINVTPYQVNELKLGAPWTSMHSTFSECDALLYADLTNFDTSHVSSFYGIFFQCTNLEELRIGGIDTSYATNLSRMFAWCRKLKTIDTGSFNTYFVSDMSEMFWDCKSLELLDVSHFDTSKVTNMYLMFAGCEKLTSLNLRNFNTAQVTDMTSMFRGCRGLSSLDLSSFDTRKVKNFRYMFAEFGCRETHPPEDKLVKLDLSNFQNTSAESYEYMFSNFHALKELDISKFQPTPITSDSQIRCMFDNCFNLRKIRCTGAMRAWLVQNADINSLRHTHMMPDNDGVWELVD